MVTVGAGAGPSAGSGHEALTLKVRSDGWENGIDTDTCPVTGSVVTLPESVVAVVSWVTGAGTVCAESR